MVIGGAAMLEIWHFLSRPLWLSRFENPGHYGCTRGPLWPLGFLRAPVMLDPQ